jgi:hypothetical protein
MNRRKFIGIVSGAIAATSATAYGLSDKRNSSRADLKPAESGSALLTPDEYEMLLLASLAPSGHNTQPWFVQRLEPYHWVIGNDKTRWLPAVDPTQRETVLSLGAFIQNLEYAAGAFGYECQWNLLAKTNQDERVMEVKLVKAATKAAFDTQPISQRRTVRSGYLPDTLKPEDLKYIADGALQNLSYFHAASREAQWLNEQTIEANRLQTYREDAQRELADWIRFSSKEAARHRDELTTASMEIAGVAGWMVRNFYGKDDVLKIDFRERGLEKVKTQVSEGAGWLCLTSPNDAVATLLETGRRMERLFLRVRERGLALHPMTQILEEAATRRTLPQAIGLSEPVQFILRIGYLKDYPMPVSLRRSVDWFVRS